MRGGIAKKGNNYYPYLWINGKKKWFSGAGSSKRKAEKILNDKVAEVQNGTYQELKKIKFKDFAKLWIESYAKTKVKPSTLRSYKSIIDSHLKPVFGDFQLMRITTAMLQKYVAKRLESVKPKTVINELVPVKEMFKHSVRWGYLKVSPAEYVEKPRVEKEEMDILTPDEIRLFLDKVEPEYQPFFLSAVLTGMRRGELLGLQWGDIDWNHNQIHVRRSLCNTEKDFITPKSKYSVRRVDMSPTLVKELKKHKLACSVSESDLVFCNPAGKFLDPDNLIKRKFYPALRRAKIRRVRFHDLRHTNVSLRIEQGQNIVYISRQIGHGSVKTTLDIYGHLIKEVNSDQAKKLDSILGFVEQPDSLSEPFGRKMVEMEKEKDLRKTVSL